MPYDPQKAAEDFIQPGTDLDKLAQVEALASIIANQAVDYAALELARKRALETKLTQAGEIATDLRANAQAVVDATTAQARRTAFQSLALNIQQLKGVLQ